MKNLSRDIRQDIQWFFPRIFFYKDNFFPGEYEKDCLKDLIVNFSELLCYGIENRDIFLLSNKMDLKSNSFLANEVKKCMDSCFTLNQIIEIIKIFRTVLSEYLMEKKNFIPNKEDKLFFVSRIFDIFELCLFTKWEIITEPEKSKKTKDKNNKEDKDKYFEIFLGLKNPVFYVNPHKEIEKLNVSAVETFWAMDFDLNTYLKSHKFEKAPDWLLSELKILEFEGTGEISFEKELLTNNGKKHFDVSIKEIPDLSGFGLNGSIVVFNDIDLLWDTRKKFNSTRRMLEHELSERSGELNLLYKNLKEEVEIQNTTLSALKESEAKFRLAFENSNIGMAIVRIDGLILKANKALAGMIDAPLGSIENNHMENFVEEIFKEELKGFFKRASSGEVDRGSFQRKWYRSDGKLIWTNEVCSFVNNSFIKNPYFIFHIIDITKGKKFEEELNYSKKLLSLRNAVAEIFLTKTDKDFLYEFLKLVAGFNKSRHGIFGYLDEKQDLICTVYPKNSFKKFNLDDEPLNSKEESFRSKFFESIKTKKSFISNEEINFPKTHVLIENTMIIPIIHHEKVIGGLMFANKENGYSRDDSIVMEEVADYLAPILFATLEKDQKEKEKIKLETQLIQSQKVEALGVLASGIAHDFNNILTPILGYAELSISEIEADSSTHENISEIIKASKIAKDLVGRILAFSRQKDPEFINCKLQDIINGNIRLLRSIIPATIEIRTRIDDKCRAVFADPAQISQVILNLCTNAYQSMEKKGGKLEIDLSEVDVVPEDPQLKLLMKIGRHAKITIQDTGCGMKREILERIFDPYFTTKPVNKGTGLGLSVVHGIIRSHNGDIRVYSEVENGSIFNIYLPIIEVNSREDRDAFMEEIIGGDESILIVDDQKPVLDIMERILLKSGYDIFSTTSSLEALDIIKEDPKRFDLVISDLTMPDLTGLELAYKVSEIRHDLDFIICTGFSERMKNRDNTKNENIKAIIPKPIVKSEITASIRNILDQ